MTGRGVGFGKVILLGEHAVVYGHPALAAAIGLTVEVTVTPAEQNVVTVPAWGLERSREVGRAVDAIARALGRAGGFQVDGVATLPARAGLGSSAALSVAVARALGAADVVRAAHEGERVFHRNPSGVDVALAARGGLGLFTRAEGLRALTLPRFRLAVGLSGEPRDTAARVADVAALRASVSEEVDDRLLRLGELATRGAAGEDLGPLFDAAHVELAALGLSSPGLDRLRAIARDAGARGSKLTGAGGGGAVIAVGDVDAVAAAWKAAGFDAFVVELGT